MAQRNPSSQNVWSPEEDETLRVLALSQREPNWAWIAKQLKKTTDLCKTRWKYLLNPPVIERRKWEPEEDARLRQLITKYGVRNWRLVASLCPRRLPKQCRERWLNHLDPDIVKGRLSDAEWQVVLKAHSKIGNRWSEISKLLPGRTPNQIKNHWHAMSRRKSLKRKRENASEEGTTQNLTLSWKFTDQTESLDLPGENDHHQHQQQINKNYHSKRKNTEDYYSRSRTEYSEYSCNSASSSDSEFSVARSLKGNKCVDKSMIKLDALVKTAEVLYKMEKDGITEELEMFFC